ncbi:hypothetical protein DNAM5_53 [Bacillus phage Vinny]|uniref:Uncharacterized protein n=1 Tax=Bacillus phage Vinny TaxID=1805955 RepID=A0A143FJY6_9CAUD|nr:hypothetical protein DNAM5_53 [Bacillus phage Vinny]
MIDKMICLIKGHKWEYDGYVLLSSGRQDKYICRTCKCVKYNQ